MLPVTSTKFAAVRADRGDNLYVLFFRYTGAVELILFSTVFRLVLLDFCWKSRSSQRKRNPGCCFRQLPPIRVSWWM